MSDDQETGLKIFKYQLPIAEKFTLELPDGAKILRIDGVDGGIFLWALVRIESPLVSRSFVALKTGGEPPLEAFSEDWEYRGCGAIYIQQELMLYFFEDTKNVSQD